MDHVDLACAATEDRTSNGSRSIKLTRANDLRIYNFISKWEEKENLGTREGTLTYRLKSLDSV